MVVNTVIINEEFSIVMAIISLVWISLIIKDLLNKKTEYVFKRLNLDTAAQFIYCYDCKKPLIQYNTNTFKDVTNRFINYYPNPISIDEGLITFFTAFTIHENLHLAMTLAMEKEDKIKYIDNEEKIVCDLEAFLIEDLFKEYSCHAILDSKEHRYMIMVD